MTRDTDADWREIGLAQPYWGVLAQPEFEQGNLTAEALGRFYASGVADIRWIVDRLDRHTGAPPSGRALDFGCGVGRLTEAMSAFAEEVVGFDISPGMLACARARDGKAAYVNELPVGPFNWINSLLVFQHIPPERGMAILSSLIERLAPNGWLSLQITVSRHERLKAGGRLALLVGEARLEARRIAAMPRGSMAMYDYDLALVLRRLAEAGIAELGTSHADLGGHYAVTLFGRRTPGPR